MSSPFASRLGTNHCPQDEELARIKGLLIEPCLRLKRLEDDIAVMQKAIDKLKEERDAVSAFVEAHKALASPLRRLPLDLIQEIFMACLPTNRNCVMSAIEAPVLLGRVCSSWRNISLSTPRLWSRLHVVEPTRPYNDTSGIYETKVAQRLEVANAWLQRSGMCPLSISLESNLDHPDEDVTPPLSPQPLFTPSQDLFLDALIPFSSRWQNIRLSIPAMALQKLAHLTEADVPLLQYLKIVQGPEHPGSNNTHQSNGTLSLSSILRGPNLSRFSLTGSSNDPSNLPLRWNQLTALSLVGPAWGTGFAQTCMVIWDILSRCPKLRACKLLVHGPPEGDHAGSIIECPSLHALDLVCIDTPLHTLGILLSPLSLPALRDFGLSSGLGGFPGVFNADGVVAALVASTHLERVSVDTNTFSKSSLMGFLRGLPPTVRRLQITEPAHVWRPSLVEPTLDDEVLAVLNASPDSPAHCPALEEFVIHHCRTVSDEALLRFIVSRVPTLRLVEVKFDRERQVDILPNLPSFVEAGGKTSLTYITLTPPQFSPWLGLPDMPLSLGMRPLPPFY
ncbi:hypothetical protein MVEN_01780800 [Mycena venus]|uniref:F-box domain-containing protein n=1 Tax=Mycena venus TaxID=2733690 RepID=A0A8H7CMR4_9AGAR|nr:hypothetical protein MVEN_01780800 [Mycena venus]